MPVLESTAPTVNAEPTLFSTKLLGRPNCPATVDNWLGPSSVTAPSELAFSLLTVMPLEPVWAMFPLLVRLRLVTPEGAILAVTLMLPVSAISPILRTLAVIFFNSAPDKPKVPGVSLVVPRSITLPVVSGKTLTVPVDDALTFPESSMASVFIVTAPPPLLTLPVELTINLVLVLPLVKSMLPLLVLTAPFKVRSNVPPCPEVTATDPPDAFCETLLTIRAVPVLVNLTFPLPLLVAVKLLA